MLELINWLDRCKHCQSQAGKFSTARNESWETRSLTDERKKEKKKKEMKRKKKEQKRKNKKNEQKKNKAG